MSYIDNLIQFAAGSKALASEVNQNFEALKTAVNNSVKKDGSIPFTAEVEGVTPTKTQSIATKGYVDSSSGKLFNQCVNVARIVNGQADFISSGSGLKPRILALAINLIGNGQYKDRQNKFSFVSDIDLPDNAPASRRSTIIYKNWSTTPVYDYANQRPQFDSTFDITKNLLVDFTGGNANDKYGNILTTVGSPTYTGDKFNSNGTTGLKYAIPSLGQENWSIEGKFKFNNTTASFQLFDTDLNVAIVVYRTSANKLGLYLSTDGANSNIANNILGTKTDFDTTTEYFIRLTFDGLAYKLAWSTTGLAGSYTTEITVVSALKIASGLGNIRFGMSSGGTSNLAGTMDNLRVTVGNIRVDGEAFTPDAYWFDNANKVMKYGSPASWAEVQEAVPLGEITTNGSAVTSAVSYALNGRAISPILAGTNNTTLNFADNLGIENKKVSVRSRFNAGYQWSYQQRFSDGANLYGYSPTVKNSLLSSAEMNPSSNYVAYAGYQGFNSYPAGTHSTGDVQIIVERNEA